MTTATLLELACMWDSLTEHQRCDERKRLRRLTIGDVAAVVERIREYAETGNDEAAHSLDDTLRGVVLEAIVMGARQARSLAAMALTTDDIDFTRWCS